MEIYIQFVYTFASEHAKFIENSYHDGFEEK